MLNHSWLLSFFLLLSCISASYCNHDIARCLGEKGVTNFTVFPQDNNKYYTFLDFSIQNLRFAEPSVPKPVAIVLPESREQVVSTVACCRNASLEIRVRSGGHSYEGTSSVAIDGLPFLIIDLMNLDGLVIDCDSRTAWVEAGATLGKAYYSISESCSQLGFSAGSCPTVGIGGHVSGGGFGLLSRKHGLAADSVLDAVLVDANGRVLNRESMGEDVFWAIRGGGGGTWGVVLAWKIRLVQVPQTVTAFVVSRSGTKRYVASLVKKWQRVSPNLSDDFYLSVFVGAGLPEMAPATGISATFKGFYLGTKHEMVSTLTRAFTDLNVTPDDCKEMRWIESVVYFSGLRGNISATEKLKDRYLAEKLYFKAKSDYVRTPIPDRGIATALDILEKQAKGYVILDPYGGFMDRVGTESIPFPHRRGNLFSIQYMVEWRARASSPEEEEYMDWIRGFYEAMTPYVSSGPRAAYINYMDLDLGVENHLNDDVERARVWGHKYFLGNYDRLVKAKTLVDPLNVFRHQQGIPPAPTIISSQHL